MRRALRALTVALVVIGGAGAAALAGLAYLPQLEEQRRELAERLLEHLLDRPVTVAGPVRIRPGRAVSVAISDAALGEGPPEAWRGTLTVREARASFPLWRALTGDLGLDRLEADGLAVAIAANEPGVDSGPFRPSALVAPLARLLDSGVTRSLALRDVRFERQDHPDGWNGRLDLDALTASEGDSTAARTITAEGQLNGRPLRLNASFGAPLAAARGDQAGRAFRLHAVLPGFDEVLEGVLDADGGGLDASLEVEVSSLGDVLEALLLRRQLEGTGRLRVRVAGAIDHLAAAAIDARVELATGEVLTLDGRIADLSATAGVDLAFTADLRRRDGSAAQPSRTLEVRLETLRGRITGNGDALTLSGLILGTDLAAADIRDIGPMSVARVTRDAEGRLGLQGVHVLAGDPAAPSLELRGRVRDLLGQSGIALDGRFDLDLLELVTGTPTPAPLGRFAGRLALSDASGALQVDSLTAAVTGDGPVALSLAKETAGGPASAAPVEVVLDIPDLDALARALDAPPIGGGGLAFAGEVEVSDAVTTSGRGTIGRSAIWVDVRNDVTAGAILIRGRLRSPRLHLADLPRIAALGGLWPEPPDAGGGPTPGEQVVRSRLDAELDLSAALVDGAGGPGGAFTGHLAYRAGEATLGPLALDYLGGRIEATVTVGAAEVAPPVSLRGTATEMNMAAILTELGIQPLATGAVNARVDLTGRGRDRPALEASLAGTIELALSDGTVGTRLIDLAGQDVVSWLFSRGGDTRLVCADARLRFAAGRGTVERLVIETEAVQLVGTGTIDVGRDRLDLAFVPRPLRERLIGTVTSFRVQGSLDAPRLVVSPATGIAGRAVVETLTLPFNVLGALLGGGNANRRPCAVEP